MQQFNSRSEPTIERLPHQDDNSNSQKMSDLDLAYIAGFFDGEGSITIHENCHPSPRGKSPNHTLQVSIGNTDKRVLTTIHEGFGGSLTMRAATKPNHRDVAQWIIRSNGAARFLSAILPFVRMKTEQAKIGLSFQSEKGNYRRERLTDEHIAFREEKRKAIRLLNGRNVA